MMAGYRTDELEQHRDEVWGLVWSTIGSLALVGSGTWFFYSRYPELALLFGTALFAVNVLITVREAKRLRNAAPKEFR